MILMSNDLHEPSSVATDHNNNESPHTYFVPRQTEHPGCWDGQLLNSLGEPYSEIAHGLDPISKGFSYCAPWVIKLT